jgi:hypothetical protein
MFDNWERSATLAMAFVLTMVVIACLYNTMTFFICRKKSDKRKAATEFCTYTFCFMPIGFFMCFGILGGWYFDKNNLLINFAIKLASTIVGIVMIVYVIKMLNCLLKHKKEKI